MRALIQRVKEARVIVENETVGEIEKGLLIFLGVQKGDEEKHINWLVNKIISLRIFPDEAGKMNCSLKDVEGSLLIVSQFTLYGNCQNGRRPDFFESAPPEQAEKIYSQFIKECKKQVLNVSTGVFGAMMEVQLINDGPVTFMIDGKK
ncbi:MAG: D-tyrosyl-tRNA(Tyr) deacylase [Waddliaceae bacterium]|nr:D-tyrosyl-tRNA(Tyr) deacylase [Waddliaceae bacterium]